MNYGKRKASKKQKDITSKSNMRKKKIGVRLFKGFLICLLLFCVAGVIGGGIFIKKIIDDAPEITPASIKPKDFASLAFADDDTTQTGRFVTSGSNRMYKSIDDIPKDLQHAFVAIEDSRFYKHNGIDLQGIARAFVVGLTNGGHFSEGASTLTQQLVKNNVFPDFVHEDTFFEKVERKLQEQYLSLQVEKQMDKETILESYMNTINLGQNTLGVQAAAKRYFGKDVSELTLSECATIAGITQNPGRYNPVTNPEDNAKRRKKVLKNMLEQGYIDQAAYDEALADDVYSRIQTVNTAIEQESNVNSYFIDALSEQVLDDLSDRLGYTETQAYNTLYGGGLSIFTTQNMTIQNICDEEMNNDDNYPSGTEWGLDYALTVTHADGTADNYTAQNLASFGKNEYHDDQPLLFSSQEAAQERIDAFKAGIVQEGDTVDEYVNLSPQPQASLSVIDHSNGQIKALVGGRGAKTTNRGLNRAYQGSTRSAGSCFKILAVYAPALDSAGQSLATIIKDEPYNYQSTGRKVHNWWGESYRGNVTMREAIEQSMNICAVKTLNEIGIPLGYEYCTDKFGLTTLDEKSDSVESLALGGITHGVYNYEINAAYAAIANGGVYNEPILYTKILDHDGNVLIDNTKESKTILKDSTAALLTSAMEDVVNKGTATDARLNNMPAAGKSGTTSDNKDLWFCGYTPYYSCAIWTGYDQNKSLSDYQWNYHFKIWAKVMNRIDSELGLAYKDFTMPSSLVKKTICTETGKLALAGSCPAITEWFAADTAPTEVCPGHQPEEEEPKEEEPKNEEPKEEPGGGSSSTVTPPDPNGGGNNNGGNGGGGSGGGDNNNGGGNSGGGSGGGDNNSGGNGGGSGGGDNTTTPPAQ